MSDTNIEQQGSIDQTLESGDSSVELLNQISEPLTQKQRDEVSENIDLSLKNENSYFEKRIDPIVEGSMSAIRKSIYAITSLDSEVKNRKDMIEKHESIDDILFVYINSLSLSWKQEAGNIIVDAGLTDEEKSAQLSVIAKTYTSLISKATVVSKRFVELSYGNMEELPLEIILKMSSSITDVLGFMGNPRYKAGLYWSLKLTDNGKTYTEAEAFNSFALLFENGSDAEKSTVWYLLKMRGVKTIMDFSERTLAGINDDNKAKDFISSGVIAGVLISQQDRLMSLYSRSKGRPVDFSADEKNELYKTQKKAEELRKTEMERYKENSSPGSKNYASENFNLKNMALTGVQMVSAVSGISNIIIKLREGGWKDPDSYAKAAAAATPAAIVYGAATVAKNSVLSEIPGKIGMFLSDGEKQKLAEAKEKTTDLVLKNPTVYSIANNSKGPFLLTKLALEASKSSNTPINENLNEDYFDSIDVDMYLNQIKLENPELATLIDQERNRLLKLSKEDMAGLVNANRIFILTIPDNKFTAENTKMAFDNNVMNS